MELKIDTCLPLSMLKKATFAYTGPDFKSFPCGAISSFINYFGREFERIYPLTVSITRDNKLINSLFCFGFFYINNNEDLVLFLTYPYRLDRSKGYSALDFFLARVEELARSANTRFIEVEFHEEITSVIAFPTSLSHFSYDLSKIPLKRDDLSFFQQRGFHEEKTILCYEREVPRIESKPNQNSNSNDYTIRYVDSSEFWMLKEKASTFPLRAYTLSARDPFVTFNTIPFLPATVSAAYRGDEPIGFIRWSPDLLEISKKYSLAFPLLFPHILEEYSFKCGKIFDWSFKVENTELFSSLLSHVLYSMKQGGLENCQFAYITNEQPCVKAFLEQYGFRSVHATRLLKKVKYL